VPKNIKSLLRRLKQTCLQQTPKAPIYPSNTTKLETSFTPVDRQPVIQPNLGTWKLRSKFFSVTPVGHTAAASLLAGIDAAKKVNCSRVITVKL